MWKEIISNNYELYEFLPPALEREILCVEKELGVKLPNDLINFLLETNGLKEAYGCYLIWPLSRIREDNLLFWNCEDFKNIYMPFDCLLFFADAGNGDQFAFSIVNGEIRRNDIFVWNHENDSRTWVAPSLKEFLVWDIKV